MISHEVEVSPHLLDNRRGHSDGPALGPGEVHLPRCGRRCTLPSSGATVTVAASRSRRFLRKARS
ncbi:MAG: hypothetical protein ACYCXN_05030, partial [Acidimicrobiales bacterium]